MSRVIRLARSNRITLPMLIRSRMAMVHSSGLLFRRDALVDGIGLVEERLPRSQNEDWDLLLRAAQRRPIVHVDEPLINVRWESSSHYRRDWTSRVDSSVWMLEHHAQLKGDRRGSARVMGQIAFGHAQFKDSSVLARNLVDGDIARRIDQRLCDLL